VEVGKIQRPVRTGGRRSSTPGPSVVGIVAGLGAIVLCVAASAPAQDPSSFEARAEYLLRRLDAGTIPTPMLASMLRDPYPESRILAIRAAASSADPSQVLLLGEYLRDRDYRVRYQVMVAAGRLGSRGRALALKGLNDPTPTVRQVAAWAACHGGDEALAPLMAAMDTETDIGVRATAVANLWRFEEADWVVHASKAAVADDVQLRRAAAYSLARTPRTRARASLRGLAADAAAVIRATAVAGLRRAPLARDDLMVVERALTDADPRVRAAACWVLAEQAEPTLGEKSAELVSAMWTGTEPHLRIMALRAAGARPEIGSDAELVELVRTEGPWVASEAFAAAVHRGGAGVAEITGRWLSSEESWRRTAVASVASVMGQTVEKAVAEDTEASVRIAWLGSLGPEEIAPRVEILEKLVKSDPDPVVRATALTHLSTAGAAGDFAELMGLARVWEADEMANARAAALTSALALAATDEQRELVLERATDDRNPEVAALVIDAARSAGLPARSQERELRHNRGWYLELVDWMRGRHWLDVKTDRGGFRIRLESMEAPITAREISELAAAGFYDDLVIHRVVPNFVVQGGDPRGDGWGGPGFILPDEPAFRPFDSWRVGIATSGPNTGGSQLFFTLMPADHLVGHYTNVGEVVSGREVLARLEVGDRIRGIEAFSGDEPAPPSPVLLGPVEWSQLEEIPGWLEEFQAKQPDAGAVDRLLSAAGSYRVVTVLGTWCHDSQREVPRLVKVLDQLDPLVFSHEMIGVDPTRRIDDGELAAVAGVERTVERVATIVVFDADGTELGRVVETAEKPIEDLLVEFVAPREGW
jgi:cyclophilin family peptidyl-prolyl cis-trans isomerase